MTDADELAGRVWAVFSAPTYRPPSLPQVALDVLTLSQQPYVDFRQVAEVMERDPVLAGRVLGAANSPAYRGAVPMRTIRDALQRLGLAFVRDLLVGEAVALRVFSTGSGYAGTMAKLRAHAAATGHLARLVAQAAGTDAPCAFLCGLLHDIGFAAILLAMGSISRGQVPPDLGALWPIAEQAHTRVGGLVARLWGMPEEVARVIENHTHVRPEGELLPQVATVILAEDLASTWGLAFRADLPPSASSPGPDMVTPEAVAAAQQVLGLDDAAMNRLLAEAMAVLSTLR